ncbi:NUDIX hydrolase N-terminal domain-containing protein [Terriglobus saanensis]|uniref:NUDIX hydrolase n=1 Tax=Terriglobus saanensis (strain ATCC BAA-1853 / DSM 23119 / SP1PR4) TaxID=401053 RepID=E8UYG4_TERSS|nr:NUDIX hydrolase N-terminal domain-containing protein [Terriglobus saanensis]ADV82052.1 NUDIX hydrolase [Terriglobus saanensis SP1PR4]
MPLQGDRSMTSAELLLCAQRIQAISQAGIAYATNAYDLERYQQLRALSVDLLQSLSDEPYEKIIRVFASETGYQTPKVDIRAVMFNESRQILLVKEKVDQGRWTVPGGWADVGHTPFEVAEKETEEETGLHVRAERLLMLCDKKKYPHPPQPWYVYKAFILCKIEGGTLAEETSETGGARWFSQEDLAELDLSTDRVTHSQLEVLFRFAEDPTLPTLCD